METIWQDTEAGAKVLEKLSDEKTLNSLSNILDRLSFIDKAIESLQKGSEQVPGLIAMGVDTTDSLFQEATTHGVDIEERIKKILPMLEKLTQPKNIERLENLLQFTEQAPGIMSMTIDTVDDAMLNAAECGFDLGKMFNFFANINASICKAQLETPPKIGGLFGMLRAFRDPDRQRAMDFMMAVFKQFGCGLEKLNNPNSSIYEK